MRKLEVLAIIEPGETKHVEGLAITADENNTSLVYMGREGDAIVALSYEDSKILISP